MEGKILERFKMQKLRAFTLAEIIITMGIVGVIAALTVPGLMSDYQNKTMATKVRKTVNEIETTIDQYITAEGKTKFSQTKVMTESQTLDDFVKENFKVVKSCGDAKTCKKDCTDGDEACAKEVETCKKNIAAAGCFANDSYLNITKGEGTPFKCVGSSYVLADSSAICLDFRKTASPYIVVFLDVNGPEPPNISGRDMFRFIIKNNGTINPGKKADCLGSNVGAGCLDLLRDHNWIMDY